MLSSSERRRFLEGQWDALKWALELPGLPQVLRTRVEEEALRLLPQMRELGSVITQDGRPLRHLPKSP